MGIDKVGKEERSKAKSDIRDSGVTLRVGLISLIAIGLFAWINIRIEALKLFKGVQPDIAPSPPAIIVLLIMLAVTLLFRGRLEFGKKEMVVTYVLVMIGTILGTSGLVYTLAPQIMALTLGLTNDTYASTPDRWEPFLPIFSKTLGVPTDEAVVIGFWLGADRSGLRGVPWSHWVKPIIIFTIYFFALYIFLLCMASLVRRRWLEHEHLTYPLVRPIYTLLDIQTDGTAGQSTWKNKLLWIGMLIGGLPLLWNWASKSIMPGIPPIILDFQIAETFWKESGILKSLTRTGWGGLAPFALTYDPIYVGASFFAPNDVLFSIVFFQLLFTVMRLILYVIDPGPYGAGFRSVRGVWQFVYNWSGGAFFAIAIMTLVAAKQEIKLMWKVAFGGGKAEGEDDEPMSYKWMFIGIIGSAVVFVLMGIICFQMPIHLSIGWLLACMAAGFGTARARGMVGYPDYPGVFHSIEEVLGGTKYLGKKGMVGYMLARQRDFRDSRQAPMAWALEAYKFAEDLKIDNRRLTKYLLFVFPACILLGFITLLPVLYKWGARNVMWNNYGLISVYGVSWFPYDVTIASGKTWTIGISMAIGALITWFLGTMQMRYARFPLSALGFALAGGYKWYSMWFNALIAWVVKGLALRWGGARAYKNLQPLFVGIILGATLTTIITPIIDNIIIALT